MLHQLASSTSAAAAAAACACACASYLESSQPRAGLAGWLAYTVKQHAAVRWPRGANELQHEAAAAASATAAYAMLAAISLLLATCASLTCLHVCVRLSDVAAVACYSLAALKGFVANTNAHSHALTHTPTHSLPATR